MPLKLTMTEVHLKEPAIFSKASLFFSVPEDAELSAAGDELLSLSFPQPENPVSIASAVISAIIFLIVFSPISYVM